jgi:hypothetical protein
LHTKEAKIAFLDEIDSLLYDTQKKNRIKKDHIEELYLLNKKTTQK